MFQWSAGSQSLFIIVAGLLRRQMLNSSAHRYFQFISGRPGNHIIIRLDYFLLPMRTINVLLLLLLIYLFCTSFVTGQCAVKLAH